MCFKGKQILNGAAAFAAFVFIIAGSAAAGELPHAGGTLADRQIGGSAGGVAIGDGAAGITDRAWVTAPPNYLYVVEKERGSFLDCGEGQEARAADADGRDMATLRCGVTLTETIVIPAAASSAKVIIHF